LSSLAIVDDRVPLRLRYLAKHLSQHVNEQLDQDPVQSVDKHLEAFCNQVTRTIHSREFAAGQRRLVSYEQHGIPKGYESNAAQLELIPAGSIRTSFWLDDDGELSQIGGGETKFYLDHEAARIWIGTVSPRSARPLLARAINRYSEPFQLKDLSSLEAILSVAPGEIAEILDEREVPLVGAGPAGDWRFFDPAGAREEIDSDSQALDGDDWSTQAPDGEDASPDEPMDETSGNVEHGGSSRDGGLPLSSNGSLARDDTEASATVGPNGSGGLGSRRPVSRTSNGSQKVGGTAARLGTDDAPPTRPGHGNSGSPSGGDTPNRQASGSRPRRQAGAKGDSRQKGRYLTYVVPTSGGGVDEGDSERNTEPSESEALEIGAAAVRVVLDFETRHGRMPREMPHHNPGYDIVSESPTGELRYIEVKGIDGAWGERGVALSHTQFKFAQLRAGDAWLYVVEHARGPLQPILTPIQAPAAKVTQFIFDVGWKAVATETANHSNTARPTIGDEVMIEGGEVVKVAAIELLGDLIRIAAQDVDGSVRKIIWQPGNHMIVQGDQLGEDDSGAA
jgi:hypothetical protein